jgi:hypothetical protein
MKPTASLVLDPLISLFLSSNLAPSSATNPIIVDL